MLKRSRIAAAACLAAACSAPATSTAQADGQGQPLPAGVSVGPSGYWSILSAPDSPPGPPMKRGPQNERTYYAELAGVSNAEAQRRLDAQEQMRPEFERLLATLRAKERGNYTTVELVHRPDWAYRIYFKRAPAATLAKYTKNPRFQARSSAYTEAELNRMAKPWIDRMDGERLITGYGMNARHGTGDIDLVVSEAEFAAIAKRKGWGRPPAFLNLKYTDAPIGRPVDPAIATHIRIFPQSDRNLGITNQAAFGGRIVLKDGCFFVIGLDGSEKLAYFAREVGLGVYGGNHLSLFRRDRERSHLGRIGEHFTWGGPIGIAEDAPMVKQLRAQCGSAPLMHVGVPSSSAMFNARYGLNRPVLKPGEVPAAPPPPPKPPARASTGG